MKIFQTTLEEKDLILISPLSLAFIGDAVHTLLVRQYLMDENIETPKKLHNNSASLCCASSQALMLDKIESVLTEEEKEIVRRTRNAKNHNAPKSSSLQEYKKATCFEALFGYVYLKKDFQRLNQLFENSLKE